MKTLREENGQALVITVLSMTILLGFAALAGDVGIMYRTKRVAQTAADAAAIAGAQQIIFGNTGNVTTAAVNAAAQNGMSTGVNGATITVNNPPQNGPFASKTNTAYVEVIASQVEPTIFMKMFNFNSLTVSSRAVAYSGGAGTNCLYVMNTTAQQALHLQGSFSVSAPNCGVIVNSNAANALDCTGSGKNGTLTAGSIGISGGSQGCNPGALTPTPVQNVPFESDPIAATLPQPPTPPSNCPAPSGGTLTGTIAPSTPNGIACYSGNVVLNNVVLTSGTYVFTGNVQLGNVSGVGTLDINNGSLSIFPSAKTINFTAPSGTPWPQIAIMQPLNNTNQMQLQFGSATGTIQGIIWAPGAPVFLQDSGGSVSLITDLIVNTLDVQTTTLNLQSLALSGGPSPLKKVVLVE